MLQYNSIWCEQNIWDSCGTSVLYPQSDLPPFQNIPSLCAALLNLKVHHTSLFWVPAHLLANVIHHARPIRWFIIIVGCFYSAASTKIEICGKASCLSHRFSIFLLFIQFPSLPFSAFILSNGSLSTDHPHRPVAEMNRRHTTLNRTVKNVQYQPYSHTQKPHLNYSTTITHKGNHSRTINAQSHHRSQSLIITISLHLLLSLSHRSPKSLGNTQSCDISAKLI